MSRWFRLSNQEVPTAVISNRRRTVEDYFARLNDSEIDAVRKFVVHLDRRLLREISLLINRLSNGWVYPILATILVIAFGPRIYSVLIVASLTALSAHIFYPLIKRNCHRARPFDHDPTIPSLLKTLDIHSFPSGHVMTATAVFVILAVAMPSLLPLSTVAVPLIAWARISAGHHYPSDLFAGFLLGLIMTGPALVWLL